MGWDRWGAQAWACRLGAAACKTVRRGAIHTMAAGAAWHPRCRRGSPATRALAPASATMRALSSVMPPSTCGDAETGGLLLAPPTSAPPAGSCVRCHAQLAQRGSAAAGSSPAPCRWRTWMLREGNRLRRARTLGSTLGMNFCPPNPARAAATAGRVERQRGQSGACCLRPPACVGRACASGPAGGRPAHAGAHLAAR